MQTMNWLKLHSKEWLDGSIRIDMEPAERSVWTDLLCMAGESRRRGIIERAENIPYSREDLASRFKIPLSLLESTLEKCIKEGRITNGASGTLCITHWDRFQAVPEDKQRLTGHELELAERLKLNKLANKYPVAALNAEKVKALREEGLDGS